MRGWLFIFLAGLLEVVWAFGLKIAQTPVQWGATVFCVFGAFAFLVMAAKRMEASMAYVVFVVFGTIGAYALDVLLFDKQPSFTAIISIAVLLVSVVSLKKEAS